MAVRVDAGWAYRGFRAIVLENRLLRAVILPELGAKIWEFVHKPSDRNLLWQNPRIEPRAVPVGGGYDDNWCGGWDELFPNDAPVVHNGEALPDHGELWCQPWEWEVRSTAAEATVGLRRPGCVTPTRMEKWITLREGESVLRFRHRLENQGAAPIRFLWKLHPALAIAEHSRIDLPLGRAVIPEDWPGRLGEGITEFEWPMGRTGWGEEVDMRLLPPPTAGTMDFFYGVELSDGWCALTDARERVGFGLAFPRQVFSSVWLFASYGGWRGYHVAVLEPCTGYPFDLNEAVAAGRFGVLGPGESLEAEVAAVAYSGLESVQRISSDGAVE